MKTVSSKTEKTVVADLGRFRHVVSYTADDTDPKAVKVIRLEDSVVNLAAPGVASTPKGKLAYDGVSIKAEEIDICPCFASIVEDLKAGGGAGGKGRETRGQGGLTHGFAKAVEA